MPNSGKSNIINGLRVLSRGFRNNKVSKHSPSVCQTRGASAFQVSSKPRCWVIDTPGVVLPNIENKEQALLLGLMGMVKSRIIGKDKLVHYLFLLLH